MLGVGEFGSGVGVGWYDVGGVWFGLVGCVVV